MVAFTFDASQHQLYGGAQALWPAGKHQVMLVSTEAKPTKDNTGHFLAFTWKGTQGETAGWTYTTRHNIRNANQQAVDIAMQELTSISVCLGLPFWNDTAQLHGRTLVLEMVQKPRNDNPDKMSNEVVGYYDQNGNPPQQNQGGAGGQQQPQQPQQPQPQQQPNQGNVAGQQPQTGGNGGFQQQPQQNFNPNQGNSGGQQPQTGGTPPW